MTAQKNTIDLLALARLLWRKRSFILKSGLIFFVFGLVIAFGTKVEFKAVSKLLPESQEGLKMNIGGLSSLAELAGIDLENKPAFLSPKLFPEIVQSESFQLDLLNTPVYFETLDSVATPLIYFDSLYTYSLLEMVGEFTVGLPSRIRKWIKGEENLINEKSNLLRLSSDHEKLLNRFMERIEIIVDRNTGVIFVEVEMPDRYAAAGITQLVVNQLTQDVTEYKTEKAKISLDFIQERFLESEKNLKEKQKAMASFTDSNKNFNSDLARIEYKGLQNEYNIAYEVYKGLATQLEQAKISIKERTPVFTTLQPVRVPNKKSKPKRLVILVLLSAFGIGIGSSLVLIKDLAIARGIIKTS